MLTVTVYTWAPELEQPDDQYAAECEARALVLGPGQVELSDIVVTVNGVETTERNYGTDIPVGIVERLEAAALAAADNR